MRGLAGIGVVCLVVAGCTATPPGKLSDDAYVLSQKHYASSPTITLARFRQGLRQCGPTSDGLVFVRHFGVADCLTAEDGHAVCDLYVGGAAGGFKFRAGACRLLPRQRFGNERGVPRS